MELQGRTRASLRQKLAFFQAAGIAERFTEN